MRPLHSGAWSAGALPTWPGELFMYNQKARFAFSVWAGGRVGLRA